MIIPPNKGWQKHLAASSSSSSSSLGVAVNSRPIGIYKPITIPPTGKVGVAYHWVHGIMYMGVFNKNVTENGLISIPLRKGVPSKNWFRHVWTDLAMILSYTISVISYHQKNAVSEVMMMIPSAIAAWSSLVTVGAM